MRWALSTDYSTVINLVSAWIYLRATAYNKPYMHDESKKPLNLRISFENDSKKDVEELYMKLYAKEYGVLPDMSAVTLPKPPLMYKVIM